MADKRIQDLTPATSVGTSDRFVLEQSGQAKSLTGQILIRDLAAALDGHGGIASIAKTGTSGLVDTYTITYAGDETTSTFTVTNGQNGADGVDITDITSTKSGLTTTVTVTMSNGTDYTFTVDDGVGISDITDTTSGTPGDGMTHTLTFEMTDGSDYEVTLHDGLKGDTGAADNLYFMWADNFPSSDSDMYDDNTGPWIGIAHTPSSSAPSHYTDYQWYEWAGPQGVAGSSIESIALTSQTGLVDLYTITLTDGNTSTFTVTNAKSIVSITMVSGSHAAGTTDVYEILFNDGDTAQFSVYNGANGLGSVSTVSGIQADGNGDVPQVISGNGAPTTATVGQTNQLYYDLTNSVLYYCAGESGGTYVWLGAGVTVDSALSGSSTNPVQNKVITGRVGTGALPNSNTNLTDAVNYVNGRIPSAASQTPLADTTGGAVGTGTNWAKNDHQHPLNVATSGTPSNLGTASNGSSANYARQDHVHKKPTASDLSVVDIMCGTALTTGENLNNLGFGVYHCQDSTTAASLVNCPVSAVFRLECKQTINSNDRKTQILYTNETSPQIYIRTQTSVGWNNWHKTNTTEIVSVIISHGNTTTIRQAGIITSDGMYEIFMASQNSSTGVASLYYVRQNGSNFYVSPIFEGTHGNAPRISSTGVLDTNTTGTNTTIKCAVTKLL